MVLGPEGRYVVENHMGEGTFGRVLLCNDKVTKTHVAVKVVKGVPRYCEHAQAEADVLTQVRSADPKGQSHCVRMLDAFLHGDLNFCLVFEPLARSIRDFLKANGSVGLLLHDVRAIARHLLESLAFMHSIGLTHTDLKCRNVMLRDDAFEIVPLPRGDPEVKTRRLHRCDIAVIDFGGAVFADERHSSRIGTRQFRAPEVVLGLPWDESSDMWSAGCIIAMLYLGERLFSVHEDQEHLAMMEKVLGVRMPATMVLRAISGNLTPPGVCFSRDGVLCWPEAAPDDDAVDRVRALPALHRRICGRHGPFLALLRGMLEFDPKRRLGASAALRHTFFAGGALPE